MPAAAGGFNGHPSLILNSVSWRRDEYAVAQRYLTENRMEQPVTAKPLRNRSLFLKAPWALTLPTAGIGAIPMGLELKVCSSHSFTFGGYEAAWYPLALEEDAY
jgi:hypothetical protein